MLSKLVSLLSSELMTKLIIITATELAKKTDNKFDDKIVELFKAGIIELVEVQEVKPTKAAVKNAKPKTKTKKS